MRWSLKKFWPVAFMAVVWILPLWVRAESTDVNVTAGQKNNDGKVADSNRFTWGVGLGVAPLGAGFEALYNSAGYGFDGNIGIQVNRDLAFVLAMDSYDFNINNKSIFSDEVNLIPSIRYSFGSHQVRPYLIAGFGLNADIYLKQDFSGTTSYFQVNPVGDGGVGIALQVSPGWDIYLQCKYEYVFSNAGNFSYFPIAAGVQFN